MYKKIFNNTVWAIVSKLVTATLQFVSVPLLLAVYGKEKFGLIALILSINLYLNIFLLGLPNGLVKYLAGWWGKSEKAIFSKASKSNLTLNTIVGFLNCLIFLLLGEFGHVIFDIPADHLHDYRNLFYIASINAVLLWSTNSVNPILTAVEDIAAIEIAEIISRVLRFVNVIIVYSFKFDIITFFILDVALTHLRFPFKLLKVKKYIKIKEILSLGWFWKEYKIVLTFSLGLFVISLSQMLTLNIRPIILGIRNSLETITEYHILYTITTFVFMINLVVNKVLLPISSRAYAENNTQLVNKIAYDFTKLVWIFGALFLSLVISQSSNIINLYVGADYIHLSNWLVIIFCGYVIIFFGPISSLLIGHGKLKALVFSHPIIAILSITIFWVLSPQIGVGAIAIGTFSYYVLQFFVYFFYISPKILNLDTRKLFQIFIYPFFFGIIIVTLSKFGQSLSMFSDIGLPAVFVQLFISITVFMLLIFKFYLPVENVKNLIKYLIGNRV